MQKWEYCALVSVTGGSYDVWATTPAIVYFTPEGKRLAKIDREEKDHLAKAIGTLGEQGWEMVGAGTTDEKYHTLYFKRPKS